MYVRTARFARHRPLPYSHLQHSAPPWWRCPLCSRAFGVLAVMDQPADQWRSLNTPLQELCLHNTLPTGQSFRWRKTSSDTYTGVIGQRVVQLRQLQEDVHWRVVARGPAAPDHKDAEVMREYLNLDTSLAALSAEWCSRDGRFTRISPCIPGARMLQQDPTECLFQFICSSNNHISRIHGMVERLCSTYGSELLPSSSISQRPASRAVDAPTQPTIGPAAEDPLEQQQQQQLAFYAFPSLEQLSAATEDALRADGFGYRAKFIVGSVQQLLAKPEGGSNWLLNLRSKPYAEAHEALCTLPGIGPKVAACICLFSLNKHDAIPVDTHVWTLATKYYAPHLANKTLNKKLHDTIQQVFIDRFGAYAGWAHNTLFISELASHKPLLPAGLASPGSNSKGKKRSKVTSTVVSAEGCSSEGAAAAAEAIEQAVAAEAVADVLGTIDQNVSSSAAAAAADVLQKSQLDQEPAGDASAVTRDVAARTAADVDSSTRSSRRRRRHNRRYVGGVDDVDLSD